MKETGMSDNNAENKLNAGESARQILSRLRAELRADESARDILNDVSIDKIYSCLANEDAKTRKNAALLIGDLAEAEDTETVTPEEAAKKLMEAYKSEETLFVRPSYLASLMRFDIIDYKDYLEKEQEKLSSETFEENEEKHKKEELHYLNLLLSKNREKDAHDFKGFKRPFEILLTADEIIREELARQLGKEAKVTKTGVRVRCSDYKLLQKNHLYREMLFLVPIKKGYVPTADNLHEIVVNTGLLKLVNDIYGTENDSFRFRVSLIQSERKRGSKPENASRPLDVKKIASSIEENSNGRLINDAGDYEFTLVIREGDKRLSLFAELPSALDDRFSYRKYTGPTSMNAVTAAEICRLLKGYMSSKSQIMDPFCGTGTLLIERAKLLPAREYYATDTFGKAVKEARENAKAAGLDINFINRDFFDFSHDYPFQEILTEFPDLFGKEESEKDLFCKKFFEKSLEISDREGLLFVITQEDAIIRKYIRLNQELKLLRMLQVKKGLQVFVIKIRKD